MESGVEGPAAGEQQHVEDGLTAVDVEGPPPPLCDGPTPVTAGD